MNAIMRRIIARYCPSQGSCGCWCITSPQRVRLTNAKGQPIYRLVSFQVGRERYLILTNRRDLTTFQVILLYAYRWQVELIFRFLKRSLNGLHLLSHSPEGVTLHFYALLITALLELRLKQQCVALCETALSASTSPQTEADPPPIAGLMINPERLAGTRGNTFLATVGEKLHRYGLAFPRDSSKLLFCVGSLVSRLI
jgi:hypothetical protein